MKWHNNYYSVKDILKKHPIPHHCKYNKEGKIIKNHQRNWCKKIIRLAGKHLRVLANMNN